MTALSMPDLMASADAATPTGWQDNTAWVGSIDYFLDGELVGSVFVDALEVARWEIYRSDDEPPVALGVALTTAAAKQHVEATVWAIRNIAAK